MLFLSLRVLDFFRNVTFYSIAAKNRCLRGSCTPSTLRFSPSTLLELKQNAGFASSLFFIFCIACVAWAETLPEEISFIPNLNVTTTVSQPLMYGYTIDVFVPFKTNIHHYQPLSLWYSEIQGQYSPHNAVRLSLGGGYRGKGPSYPIYGVYGGLNTIKSSQNQCFLSLNIGMEWFQEKSRAYINAYIPLGTQRRHTYSQSLGMKCEGHREFHQLLNNMEEIKPGFDIGGSWVLSDRSTASVFAYYVHHYRRGVGISLNPIINRMAKFEFSYLYDTIAQHQLSAKLTLILGDHSPIKEITEEYKAPTLRPLAQFGLDISAMISPLVQEEKKTIKDNIQFFSSEGTGVECTAEAPCHPRRLRDTQAGDNLYLDENIRHDLEGQFNFKPGQSLYSRRMRFSQPSALGKGAILQGGLILSENNVVKGIYLENAIGTLNKESIGVIVENAKNVVLDQVHIGGNSIDTSYSTGLKIKGAPSEVQLINSRVHIVQQDQKVTGLLIEDGKVTAINNTFKILNESDIAMGFKLNRGQLKLEHNKFWISTNQAEALQKEALIAFEVREGKLTAEHNQFELKSEGGSLLIGRVIQGEIEQFNHNQLSAHNSQGDIKGLILINAISKIEQNQIELWAGKSMQMINILHLGGVSNINLLNNHLKGISEKSLVGLHIFGGNISAKLEALKTQFGVLETSALAQDEEQVLFVGTIAASDNQFLLKTLQPNSTLTGMELSHKTLDHIQNNQFTFFAPAEAIVQTQQPEGEGLALNQTVKDSQNNAFIRVADL